MHSENDGIQNYLLHLFPWKTFGWNLFFSMDGIKHSLVVSRALEKSYIIYVLFEIGKCDLSSMFSNILVVHPSSFSFRFAVGRRCIHQYCIGNS